MPVPFVAAMIAKQVAAQAARHAMTQMTMQQMMQQVARQMMQQMVQQLIQMGAQYLQLPQSYASDAMTRFNESGSFGSSDWSGVQSNFQDAREAGDWVQTLRAAGAPPYEIATAEREFRTAMRDAESSVTDMLQEQLNEMNRGRDNEKTKAMTRSVMAGKGSILMKLAIALGAISDQKMQDMAAKAEQIGGMGKIKAGNQAKFTQMNAELQALGQELNIVSQALSNVLKSIGEASASIARKG